MGKGKEMITLRELKEKAVSKQQQKLMGLALAYKRGDVPDSEVSDTVKDLAKSMSTKELEDFASTKHKGLPQKVDEAKSSTGYELYHRDFSSAMQHAYKHAKAKLGVDVDPEEIDKKVASGPKKPSKGKTNSYRLLDKGGKKAIQVQVYGMDNGKYELNMYKESVDINEAHDPKHVKMAIGVASDKRYKQGNYSGAVRAIEKIKKGLSKNPQVAAVLKKQNEDNNISNRSAALKPQIYNDPVTGKKKVRMVPSKSNIVKTNDPEDVKEAHDPKHVKMAIGVASDKRYKQGNYTGAVRAIEKIKKGLSKHPQVAAVLKRQNEAKDPGEYDQEGDMAKTQLKTIMRNASDLADLLDDNENMPEWVQNKITKASDYMTSAYNYMASEDDGGKMDEEMDPTKHVSKKGDMYCVYNKDGKEVAKFDNKKDADAYAIKNHDKLMEYLEVGTDAIRKSYAAMTPGQNEALAATDRAFAIGAVGAAAYAAKKAKDRFDPVKVRDARKKRAEKRAERSDAERELAQNRRDRQNYQKKLRQMRDRQNKQRNKR